MNFEFELSSLFFSQIFSSEITTKQNDTICFGTIVNHCDKPLSMDVYLQYDAMKFSLMKRLYNNISNFTSIFLQLLG